MYNSVFVVIHNSLKSKLLPIDIVTKNKFINHKIDIIGVEILTTDSQLPYEVLFSYIHPISLLKFGKLNLAWSHLELIMVNSE